MTKVTIELTEEQFKLLMSDVAEERREYEKLHNKTHRARPDQELTEKEKGEIKFYEEEIEKRDDILRELGAAYNDTYLGAPEEVWEKIYIGYCNGDDTLADHRVEIKFNDPPNVKRGYALRHIVSHSPTGYNWGYGGSGPSDCALSIMSDLLGFRAPSELYQAFKFEFVAGWPNKRGECFRITDVEIRKWMREKFPGILNIPREDTVYKNGEPIAFVLKIPMDNPKMFIDSNARLDDLSGEIKALKDKHFVEEWSGRDRNFFNQFTFAEED